VLLLYMLPTGLCCDAFARMPCAARPTPALKASVSPAILPSAAIHVDDCCCLAASHCHLAHQQHNRLLQLPGPQLNSLSKAEWAVSSSELSKAYRKLSILVHPDKMPGEKARQAFEQLKQAYNELRDPEKLVRRLLLLLPALCTNEVTTVRLGGEQQSTCYNCVQCCTICQPAGWSADSGFSTV
jgi:hypothetical protein